MRIALDVFRSCGYGGASLEQVAATAGVSLESLRAVYPDKDHLFAALIAKYSPVDAVNSVLDEVQGETAEEIVRDLVHRLVSVFTADRAFLDLAAMDVQANNGANIGNLSLQSVPQVLTLRQRLKQTGELRPVSDFILARTLVSMVIGFVLSEQMVPGIARLAMHLLPQRGWVDGMIDLMLYGVLEDSAR